MVGDVAVQLRSNLECNTENSGIFFYFVGFFYLQRLGLVLNSMLSSLDNASFSVGAVLTTTQQVPLPQNSSNAQSNNAEKLLWMSRYPQIHHLVKLI